jgi:hypothetical protein
MPTNKDFKRVVRARMKKTGESYTAARTQLLRDKKTKPVDAEKAQPVQVTKPKPADYAKVAGMSDAAVKKATGCTWERWVAALDYAKADTWTHPEIAKYVKTTFKTPDWWTQTVVVGYERIKGLRVHGQRRDGTYEVSKSKTIPAPVGELFDAFKNAQRRAEWLDVPLEVRTATKNKSLRIRWSDGTPVDVGLLSKGAGKSQVAIGHRKLASKDEATRMKTFWSEKLDDLAQLLAAR